MNLTITLKKSNIIIGIIIIHIVLIYSYINLSYIKLLIYLIKKMI